MQSAMKSYYKVVFERGDGDRYWHYYECTSLSNLISALSLSGEKIHFIVEIKRISRLPKWTFVRGLF